MIKKWFAMYRLKFGNGFARMKAINSLAEINDPDLWNILNEAMKDSWPYVRSTALRNLGTKFGMEAIDILFAALEDEDVDVRVRAVDSIVELGQKAVSPLIHSTKSNAPNTRILATRALGNIGDQQAVEPLVELLTDESPEVSWEAALALEKIPNRELVLEHIKDLVSTRSSIPNVAYLGAQCGDTEMSTQIKKSVPFLITYLQDKKRSPIQRLAVVKTLDVIGGSQAIKALLESIDDDHIDVRNAILEALARRGDTTKIQAALSEWDARDGKAYRKSVRKKEEMHMLVAAKAALDSDELKPIIEDQPYGNQMNIREQLKKQLDNMIDRYAPDTFGG